MIHRTTESASAPRSQASAEQASPVRPNFQTIPFKIEAWFYAGQPYAEMPDWIRSRFTLEEMMERQTGRYALRDEEDGDFYRWMDADDFRNRYERIIP